MSTDPFERLDVDDWIDVGREPQGSEGAVWLEDRDATRWLYKGVVIHDDGVQQGEDWSEVASTEVAKALGVPCARSQLCVRHNRNGSLSRNVRPRGWRLTAGGVWLEGAAVQGYVLHPDKNSDPRRPGHNLENIKIALQDVKAPPSENDVIRLPGFDVFAGYLILDALIANRDRHEENWAVMEPELGPEAAVLAPSYDHASSLGFNLRDGKREHHLQDRQLLEKFARNGTAYRFEHSKTSGPATLVGLAREALTKCSYPGRKYWKERIRQCDLAPVCARISELDDSVMSVQARNFAVKLLNINYERLAHVIDDLD